MSAAPLRGAAQGGVAYAGAIYFDRKDYARAEELYQRALATVDQNSYDHFDALSHLGRIYYANARYDDAVSALEKAVQTHRLTENEYVVDTWFWIARSHMKRNDQGAARTYLEKIAATDVRYEKKPQAVELLQRIA